MNNNNTFEARSVLPCFVYLIVVGGDWGWGWWLACSCAMPSVCANCKNP